VVASSWQGGKARRDHKSAYQLFNLIDSTTMTAWVMSEHHSPRPSEFVRRCIRCRPGTGGMVCLRRLGRNSTPTGSANYKRVKVHPLIFFISRCAAFTSSLLPSKLLARCHYLFFFTTLPITMFCKTVLISLAIGAISVNALAVPVAREPAPEPECESPRLFSTVPYHDLTSVSFNSPAAMDQGPRLY